jgi:hypothetical protein
MRLRTAPNSCAAGMAGSATRRRFDDDYLSEGLVEGSLFRKVA